MLQDLFREMELPDNIATLLAPEGDVCNIQLDDKAANAVRTTHTAACVQRSTHYIRTAAISGPVHSRQSTGPPADSKKMTAGRLTLHSVLRWQSCMQSQSSVHDNSLHAGRQGSMLQF